MIEHKTYTGTCLYCKAETEFKSFNLYASYKPALHFVGIMCGGCGMLFGLEAGDTWKDARQSFGILKAVGKLHEKEE